MRILVTGGAGFLGSHLCEYLLRQGHQVVCLDNLITGSVENIAPLRDRGNFHFIKHDVTEFIFVDGAIDYVLHFASPASPIDYMQLPIQTLKAGGLGTHKALGVAKAKKAKFLLASTSEVYGDPLVNPQPEEYWGNVNPIGPRSCYDESKRFAEALAVAYRRQHGIDTRIVRIFNTYGPRMRRYDGRVIPTFINQALKGEDITIFGDGKQTRSFCYVSDLIEGIYRLMEVDIDTPVNLGNPSERTIAELAQSIIELTGSKSKTVYKPLPQDDPKRRRPDISKAKKLIGWEPRVEFEQGLKKTVEYFRGEKKGPNDR